MNPFPMTGMMYSVTEWDGTKYKVAILVAGNGRVQIQYEDGLTHNVSLDHFQNKLKAESLGYKVTVH